MTRTATDTRAMAEKRLSMVAGHGSCGRPKAAHDEGDTGEDAPHARLEIGGAEDLPERPAVLFSEDDLLDAQGRDLSHDDGQTAQGDEREETAEDRGELRALP